MSPMAVGDIISFEIRQSRMLGTEKRSLLGRLGQGFVFLRLLSSLMHVALPDFPLGSFLFYPKFLEYFPTVVFLNFFSSD